jgi:mRNA-degrading endonuclease RelE of RelBE toxin-antitoxin system
MGCYSIRVGGSENRIVYMYADDRDEITILAVGRRRESAVYGAATHRR